MIIDPSLLCSGALLLAGCGAAMMCCPGPALLPESRAPDGRGASPTGVVTLPFEPALEEVSAQEIQALVVEHGEIDAVIIVSAKLQAPAIEELGRTSCRIVARMG